MKRITILLAGALAFMALSAAAQPKPALPAEFHPRGGLPNFFSKAGNARSVKAVYFGGSITAAQNGWRDITYNWMRITWPETMFFQANAAIGGTGSNLGVFRTQNDVLAENPDLVFVEFAVNDGSREPQSIVRSMEGIIRKIWTGSPSADICFVYTTDGNRVLELDNGTLPPTIETMERVADHYNIPSINMGCRVVQLMRQGKLAFTAPASDNGKTIVFTEDNVHPLSESGHPIYASVVARYFLQMKNQATPKAHSLPAPMATDNWEHAQKVELSRVDLSGWTLVTDDGMVKPFSNFAKTIYQGKVGSTVKFSFKGTVLGLYDFMGPRSPKLKVTIDGKTTEVSRFDRHCSYNRLAVLILAEDLEDKVHDVVIEVTGEPIDKGSILFGEHLEKFKQNPAPFQGVEYNISNILIVGQLVKTAPKELETRLQAADALWKDGKLPQAIDAYAALAADKNVQEEYQSLVWLRLAEAQLAGGHADDCRETLARMKSLSWLPRYHKIKISDLEIKLAGKATDYRIAVPLSPVIAASVHVDQSAAGGDGSAQKPFPTIEQALDKSAELLKSGLKKGAVEIVLHGRQYALKGTVDIDSRYSGTEANPLVIRSASATKPTLITGGVNISKWAVETDPVVLDLLPANARGKVLVADLKENGATGIDRIIFGGFGSGRSQSGTYRFLTMPVPELFCNGRLQELARWPNVGDTVVSINKFSDPRAVKWAQDDDVWLHGYWKYLYADSYEKVGGFENGRLKLLPPHNRYGFSDETRGFITESKWYALNVLSEMDTPGEWKISAERGKIWLFPPKGFDPNKCIMSTYGTGFVMKECDWVTIRDLAMEYMRGDGIVATDCNHLSLINCRMHDLSGLGIQILGGKGHLLHSVSIESMGRGGIYLQAGDKVTLEPSESLVENCYIRDLSRIDRTYTPAVLLDGVGITVQHCRFEDIPSSAIRLEGNDMLIQLNDIGRCVTESNDQGSIDIWFNSLFRGNVIRWNYFHQIGNPLRMAGAVRMDDAISGVAITENIMRNTATGIFGAVQIHGGNYNVLEGNLFIDNKTAVSNTLWPDAFWTAHFRNGRTVKILSQTPWQSPVWTSRYPELKHLYDNPNRNFILDNKVINTPVLYFKNSDNQETNKIDRIEFLNNATVSRSVDKGLKNMGTLCDPWHMIPVGEIGLYENK